VALTARWRLQRALFALFLALAQEPHGGRGEFEGRPGATILAVHPGRRIHFAFNQDALAFLGILGVRLGRLAPGGDAIALGTFLELALRIGLAVIDRHQDVGHGTEQRRAEDPARRAAGGRYKR